MNIRPLDIVIDGIVIVAGIWMYGKYMYNKGKMESRKEKKGE